MGCDNNKTNTFVNYQKNEVKIPYFRQDLKNYSLAIKDVKSMQNKLKNDNYPLNCFLVCAKSVPNLLKIILNTNKDDLIDLDKLTEYRLEANIQIFDNLDICKTIFEKNSEKNEFIIVSEDFLKCMDIKEGKEVKLDKENSQIKATFEGSRDGRIKMIIEEKSDLIYHFIDYEGESSIEANNLYTVPYNNINEVDSFLLKCLIDCLLNIDLFKNFFKKKEQTIENNKIKYTISYKLVNIMKKGNKDEDFIGKRKEFINLNKILYKGNENYDLKSLIFSLINKLSKEYNLNPNPITELFAIKKVFYYNCQNCNFQVSKNNQSSCMEFNLEEVRKFKSENSTNFFENIDIKDCFLYDKNDKISSDFFCQKCKTKIVNKNKSYKIEIFPNIFIIILDRENKINTNERIEFNIEFKNNESIIDLSNLSYNNKIIYDLIGIFSYKEENGDVNKFYNTVFCKISNNKWIYYDKYNEKEIEEMDIKIMHTPFMLFYLKKNYAY